LQSWFLGSDCMRSVSTRFQFCIGLFYWRKNMNDYQLGKVEFFERDHLDKIETFVQENKKTLQWAYDIDKTGEYLYSKINHLLGKTK